MKTFFVVSALQKDSSQLGNLNQYPTEADAIARAKNVVEMRRSEGKPDMKFYVLKVVAEVETEKAPIKVRKLK